MALHCWIKAILRLPDGGKRDKLSWPVFDMDSIAVLGIRDLKIDQQSKKFTIFSLFILTSRPSSFSPIDIGDRHGDREIIGHFNHKG
ncbi:MAG: hypothetical protein ABI056_02810 [Caulobacteraceae bacterium]